ncbi:protein FAR1-RELATED SEQUENCE 6-like [Brassica rapa]|uniref:protein FAR1-RELATED SEQUENCE 6-like n=1 Tax=Brassica campestris TaxID=3711 RepID=UPI00142E2759|nr:protein FAR1-RELATED SEQUENCE 6-like [Brassica rapa]
MELPEMLRTEFNYTCSYWKAWKAKELAIAFAQGTEEDSYKMLPQYFHVLKLANPGTITDIKTEKDKEGKTRFKYAFMSLKACIDGWKYLRKVLVVDGTHMFGKYKGVLLSASGQDANSRVFPIAFAVVESENTESWTWFFERLSTIVEDGSDLSIISDRCAAIFAAKDKWYPRAHHGICLVHLQRNVQDKYKGLQQKAMVGRAGEAFRVSEFKEIMELIKLTDWRCWDYLEKIDKKLWTRSHFEGERFNVMTSNAAESLNNALLSAHDSPIMALFEFIRRKLCTWYVSRRSEISKMKGNVPDNIQKILVEQLVLSTGLLVMPCSTWLFEVTHRPTNFGSRLIWINELALASNSKSLVCHADMPLLLLLTVICSTACLFANTISKRHGLKQLGVSYFRFRIQRMLKCQPKY